MFVSEYIHYIEGHKIQRFYCKYITHQNAKVHMRYYDKSLSITFIYFIYLKISKIGMFDYVCNKESQIFHSMVIFMSCGGARSGHVGTCMYACKR